MAEFGSEFIEVEGFEVVGVLEGAEGFAELLELVDADGLGFCALFVGGLEDVGESSDFGV